MMNRSTRYAVTAAHPVEAYVCADTLITATQDPSTALWRASTATHGTGRDYPTPAAAICGLLQSSGCTEITLAVPSAGDMQQLHADDMQQLHAGFAAGCAAGEAETQIGAVFRGSAGSLRVNHGGDGYQSTPYGIGYRCGYAAAIEHKNIYTDARGAVVSA